MEKEIKKKSGAKRSGEIRLLSIFLAAVMFLSILGFSGESAKAFNNDAKQGVVAIAFEVKNAHLYAVDPQTGDFLVDEGSYPDGPFGTGSGFFVGKAGEDPQYIVTNHHVVSDYIDAGEGGEWMRLVTYKDYETKNGTVRLPIVLVAGSCELRVYYSETESETAYVVDYGDQDKVDLALLKLGSPTDKRKPMKLQETNEDMVGDTIYTLGFPGNSDNQLTSSSKWGIDDIDVKSGVINKFVMNDKGVNRIQIDAAIHHGNSGGPLVNEEGYVIGVNTNVMSESPFEGQVEADYYAINVSHVIEMLNKNSIPYEMGGKEKKSGFPIWLIAVIAGAVVAAVVVVLLVTRGKGGAAKPAKAAAGADGTKNANVSGGAQNVNPAMAQGTNAVSGQFAGGSQAAQGNPKVRSMSVQHHGAAYPVNASGIMIGRDPSVCQVVYQEGTAGVSGRHCTVAYNGGVFQVTDLGSTYGTYLLNGTRLQPNVPVSVKAGDTIYIGDKANIITFEV